MYDFNFQAWKTKSKFHDSSGSCIIENGSGVQEVSMFVYLVTDGYSWSDKHLKSSKFDLDSTAKPSFERCQQFKRLVELFATGKIINVT